MNGATQQLARGILRWAGAAVSLGTAGFPPKVQRRLKSINVGAFTIALSCALFAATYAAEDFAAYRSAVAVNLAMMAAALTVPALHRFGDTAGPLMMAVVLLGGLFVLVGLVGRLSGIQINFIATSAAVFLVFDLRRLGLIVAVIAAAIILHITAWNLFPDGLVDRAGHEAFLRQLYATIVVTISIIVAVLVFYAFRTAEKAEAETDALLALMLPEAIAERLKRHPDQPIADSFEGASVLFADLVGFVPLSALLGPARTVAMLNQLVRGFDGLAAEFGVEKIKTIGDAYMAVAGLPQPGGDSAARMARMALRMQAVADTTALTFAVELQLRIGIALGPVTAGVIGAEKFSYDVWGEPVNLAARLENTGEPGRIQVSGTFHDALTDGFAFDRRGTIPIKGAGDQETWFLIGEKIRG